MDYRLLRYPGWTIHGDAYLLRNLQITMVNALELLIAEAERSGADAIMLRIEEAKKLLALLRREPAVRPNKGWSSGSA